MPRSFLIKKHSKVTGVVSAADDLVSKESYTTVVAPTSVIVSTARNFYTPRNVYETRILDNRYDDPKVKKTLTDLPLVENSYDDKGPYDLSIKRSPSPTEEEQRSNGHSRVSVVMGPSPPPTPPSSSDKSLTPPPGVPMISSKLNGNLLLKAELEAPPSWHRPHPFPPYLPFNFPLYSFPNRNVAHPVYPSAVSPTSEGSVATASGLYAPIKYFPSNHLMPLSPPRSLGSNSNNPTIIRPEAHHLHHPLSPRVASPKEYPYFTGALSPNMHYQTTRHLEPNTYVPDVQPTFCSTTPPWSSSEEKQQSPCPSSDSDSGRENSMVTSSLTDPKRRKTTPYNGETPRYQCGDCNKNYSTYSGLSKHRQFHCAQTQTKKSFSCKYCEKVYVSLGALKMHIRTHTLPCKCKLCGKAFSRPWLLQGHIRTHTGEKPFACQHCSRAFADRSNLRAHLQTHSDVKKYSCKACSKTFSRMSLLLKHEDGGCVAASR